MSDNDNETDETGESTSRRDAIKAGAATAGLLALGGAATGTASAHHKQTVETQKSGSTLYTDTKAINFDTGTDLSVTDNGGRQITVGASSSSCDDGGSGGDGGGSDGSSPVRYAGPGNVQSVINDVHNNNGWGMVKLKPNATYDPDHPWDVKSGVVLDCEGADISLTTDNDLIHLWRESQLHNARIDITSQVSYTSDVIRLDTAFNGSYFSDSTFVDNVTLLGQQDGTAGGTFIRCHTTGSDYLSFVQIQNVNVGLPPSGWKRQTIGDAIVLDNDGDFMNSVHVQNATIRSPNRAIVLTGDDGTVNMNSFKNVFLQPQDQNSSEVGWYIDQGSNNHLGGAIWDTHGYSDTAIRLTSSAGNNNNHVGLYDGVQVANNSGNAFHVKAIYE